MNDVIKQLKYYIPLSVADSLEHIDADKRQYIHEIRLRLLRANSITIGNKNDILIDYQTGQPISLNKSDMLLCFRKFCENSIYKYENKIKNGYITLPNGCRVGFCGSRSENGMVADISSINIRLSHQIPDASKEIFSQLFYGNNIESSLIIGEPCSGKTTILTDIARKLSNEKIRVSIVDERGEIAAVHQGVPQKDVGKFTDILDSYPKGEGMMIALRTMSPQVLICDEIGTQDDVLAMMQAMNTGVPVIASAHAKDPMQLMCRPQIKYLADNGAVSKFFFLEGAAHPGKIKSIMTAGELYEIFGDRTLGNRYSVGSEGVHR